jgi:hypothetical protein
MIEALTIVADGVRYFHQNDETTFFAWLDRMKVVASYDGSGSILYIRFSRDPTDDDLRELLAFPERCGVDMRQLYALPDSGHGRSEGRSHLAGNDVGYEAWREEVLPVCGDHTR